MQNKDYKAYQWQYLSLLAFSQPRIAHGKDTFTVLMAETDSGVASYRALGHVPPSTSNNFIFNSLLE